MKGLKGLSLLLILANCAVCAPAWAVLVTIDPDDYAPGTNLTNLIPGVSISSFSSPGNGTFSFSDVYAAQDAACLLGPGNCRAVTGANVFTMDASGIFNSNQGWFDSPNARRCFADVGTGSCSSENFRALVISFDNPTDYVQISGWFTSDWPLLYAFDSSRTLIGGGSEEGIMQHDTSAATRYQSSLTNISFVVAAGWAASSTLDAFVYNDVSVPEPGTAVLFGLALVGFAASRRTSRARAES